MSSAEMQMVGTFLLGSGVLFFIVTQILLNIWERGYRAETRKM